MRMTSVEPIFKKAPAGDVGANPHVAPDQGKVCPLVQLAKISSQRRQMLGCDAGNIRIDIDNADQIRLHPLRVSTMKTGELHKLVRRNKTKDVVNTKSQILVDVRNDWHLDFRLKAPSDECRAANVVVNDIVRLRRNPA